MSNGPYRENAMQIRNEYTLSAGEVIEAVREWLESHQDIVCAGDVSVACRGHRGAVVIDELPVHDMRITWQRDA